MPKRMERLAEKDCPEFPDLAVMRRDKRSKQTGNDIAVHRSGNPPQLFRRLRRMLIQQISPDLYFRKPVFRGKHRFEPLRRIRGKNHRALRRAIRRKRFRRRQAVIHNNQIRRTFMHRFRIGEVMNRADMMLRPECIVAAPDPFMIVSGFITFVNDKFRKRNRQGKQTRNRAVRRSV